MQGTKWVKVSEKLPELNRELLIIANGKLRKVTYYMDIVDCAESYRFFQVSDGSDDYELLHCVTHYMYLSSIPMPEGE